MTRDANNGILTSHFHTRRTLFHPRTFTVSGFPPTFQIVNFKAKTQKHECKMNLGSFLSFGHLF